jgi:NodT family efflux transporter outer membrane factor (OMF) lipoprotein
MTGRCRAAIRALGPALTMSLTACGVGPIFHRPALDVPPKFTSTEAPAAPALPVRSDWWRGFGAPELDALIEQARLASPDVQAAAARIIQADQAARVAGAPLLPSITGTGNQNWQRSGLQSAGIGASSFSTGGITTGTTTAGGATTGGTSNSVVATRGASHYFEERSYQLEATASYEVDFWGKNLDALRAAQASARASRYDAETVWLTTSSSIANTYFQALSFRDRLAIAQHNLQVASQVLDAFRGRLAVGTASLLDVSQQEALVAGYRSQLPSFESQYRQEVIALSTLVGRPPEEIGLTPVPLTGLSLPDVVPGLPASLLRRRPDVANAEEQLVAQNQTIRQDFANFFPSLTLTASGGLSSLALSTLTGPGTLILSLASSITQTIFDNGLKSGTLGGAKGRYRELAADYAKAVLQALTDTETALTQARYAAEQEALEAEAVRTAQRSADIARAQLEAGTVDIVTVLNTQTTLFGDEDNLAQVRVSRYLALVSLYKALGGGWEIPRRPGAEHAA